MTDPLLERWMAFARESFVICEGRPYSPDNKYAVGEWSIVCIPCRWKGSGIEFAIKCQGTTIQFADSPGEAIAAYRAITRSAYLDGARELAQRVKRGADRYTIACVDLDALPQVRGRHGPRHHRRIDMQALLAVVVIVAILMGIAYYLSQWWDR